MEREFGNRQRVRATHFIVARAELQDSAAQMAHALAGSIEIGSPEDVSGRATAALALPGASLVVVGTCHDLDDRVLLDMLASVQHSIRSEQTWETVPQFALVTGRDAGEVMRLLQRLACRPLRRDHQQRFMMVRPGTDRPRRSKSRGMLPGGSKSRAPWRRRTGWSNC